MNLVRPAALAALFVIQMLTPAAHAGLIFDITYNTGTFGSYSTSDVERAFNYAAQEYANAFTNNVHVVLTVGFSGNVSLGQSNSTLVGVLTYAGMKNELTTEYLNAPSAARTSAAGNFAATGPSGGNFWESRAEAKALGLIADDTNQDGTINFSNAVSYTFDPNNRAVSGEYDFIGVAEHEISEVMGRIALTGSTFSGYSNSYTADDLFRYTASGAPAPSNIGSGVYLSVNGGATSLAGFNQNGGDAGDYNGAVATDPYNASTGTNQAHSLSTADFTNLNVLGWNEAQQSQGQVPEPSTLAMFGVGALLLVWRRRRHQPS